MASRGLVFLVCAAMPAMREVHGLRPETSTQAGGVEVQAPVPGECKGVRLPSKEGDDCLGPNGKVDNPECCKEAMDCSTASKVKAKAYMALFGKFVNTCGLKNDQDYKKEDDALFGAFKKDALCKKECQDEVELGNKFKPIRDICDDFKGTDTFVKKGMNWLQTLTRVQEVWRSCSLKMCPDGVYPKSCVVSLATKDGAMEELPKKCMGNVLVIELPKADEKQYYIPLQVKNTNNVGDFSREVPKGLQISLHKKDTEQAFVRIKHSSNRTLDLDILGSHHPIKHLDHTPSLELGPWPEIQLPVPGIEEGESPYVEESALDDCQHQSYDNRETPDPKA